MPFARLSNHVSFRRYCLEVVEKPNKCKSFLVPNFFGGTTPTFLRQIVSAISCPPFGKILVEFSLLISVCEAWQRIRMQNLRRVGKNSGPNLSRLWTKVHDILRCDIRALWRSALSARVPECQKLKVRPGWHWTLLNVTIWHYCTLKG